MKTRNAFIRRLGQGLTLAFLFAGLSAHAQTILRLNHTDTPSGTRHRAAEIFAERVKEFTRGRYQILVFHSGQLGNDPKSIELVGKGSLDFTISAAGSYASIQPTLNLTALPFLLDSYEHGWRFYDESTWLAEQFATLPSKGLRVLSTWEAGFRSFTTRDPLPDPTAAKGKSMRIFPNEMVKSTMEAIGFSTQVIGVTDVYRSIQEGKVVGQENPIDTIYALRFHEVAPNITLTQHIYSPLPIVIAEKTWSAISETDRKSFERAANIAKDFSRKFVRDNETRQLEEMVASGAKVLRPDVAPFRAATRVVYEGAKTKFGAQVDAIVQDAAKLRAK
ncbi:MAG: TRAP transporter substrate-binding protein [Burkholderiales bacterium]|nr:MAG: TRAP transporter substrate-binding protein [Betaproteobacteria bacterium]TAG70458.1 MAG: TRAP transporter substrate-binding protein [Burkholderiales bacterium]